MSGAARRGADERLLKLIEAGAQYKLNQSLTIQ
jgi:hypothetical protein